MGERHLQKRCDDQDVYVHVWGRCVDACMWKTGVCVCTCHALPAKEIMMHSLSLSNTRSCTMQRLKMLVKREGRILASKDFPQDPVEYNEYDTFIQVLRPFSAVSPLLLLILYRTRWVSNSLHIRTRFLLHRRCTMHIHAMKYVR